MNILLVAEDFGLNGVTRHIIDLANGLSETGHRIIVAATPSNQNKRLNSQITFIPLLLCHPETDKKRYSGIIKSVSVLINTIHEHHIDVIHTHKRYADVIGRFAARLTGIEHISTCHNKFNRYRWVSPFGDTIIAPSDDIASMLTNVFHYSGKRVKVVYHGIKPLKAMSKDEIINKRQSLGLGNGIKVVLSVGHLNRQKDRPTLIEALHLLHLKGQFEKTVCLIVGEGEESTQVLEMIGNYQLESHIKLMPAASDIEALNNIAEFCVLSSLYEAGPYVLLEAASLGKPSIGTAVGFIPSFVGNNEAGICVESQSPQQLAEALYSLLSNPERTKELGEKAFERFYQSYMYDRFIKDTLLVYEEALS